MAEENKTNVAVNDAPQSATEPGKNKGTTDIAPLLDFIITSAASLAGRQINSADCAQAITPALRAASTAFSRAATAAPPENEVVSTEIATAGDAAAAALSKVTSATVSRESVALTIASNLAGLIMNFTNLKHAAPPRDANEKRTSGAKISLTVEGGCFASQHTHTMVNDCTFSSRAQPAIDAVLRATLTSDYLEIPDACALLRAVPPLAEAIQGTELGDERATAEVRRLFRKGVAALDRTHARGKLDARLALEAIEEYILDCGCCDALERE
jgi:hypothetical protein